MKLTRVASGKSGKINEKLKENYVQFSVLNSK